MENLCASWTSPAVQLGLALGVAGTGLCCCPSEEADMSVPLIIRLLNFIKSVLQKGSRSSLSGVLPSKFLPSDFLLGIILQ